MQFFLAGGAVRDLLLGRPLSDRDYLVTDTTPETFLKTFPNATQVGRSFPVFLLDHIEFSFPRAPSLREEIESRDLTVNAQLVDDEGNLYCHPKGLCDLHNRILRPASPRSIPTDPLRIYRGARFWSQMPDFTPHEELILAMQQAAAQGLPATVYADRVAQELRKAMEGKKPGNFLRLLARGDCLSPWFQELETARDIPAGPPKYHDCDVLEHTCRVMDRLAGDSLAVWMGLCHDLGKTLTPKDKLPTHHGHDLLGMDLAEALALRVRTPNRYKTAGIKAARWHMTAARYEELRPTTRVDMLMDLHLSETLVPMFKLVRADHGLDFLDRARTELDAILPVRLPPEDRNQGALSGEKLRLLRAKVLRQLGQES